MVRKRRRKHNLVLCISVFVFAVYAAFTLINTQLKVAAKRRELEALNVSIRQQELENAQAKRLLQIGEDDAYVEYMARERLGYAYPDEKILIDRSAG